MNLVDRDGNFSTLTYTFYLEDTTSPEFVWDDEVIREEEISKEIDYDEEFAVEEVF